LSVVSTGAERDDGAPSRSTLPDPPRPGSASRAPLPPILAWDPVSIFNPRSAIRDPHFSRLAPRVYCFAPGTPQEVIDAYNQRFGSPDTEPFFYYASSWLDSTGSPRALTWSFVPDGVIVDGQPSELFARLDSQFASAGGRARWVALFEECFARWALLSGTSYTRIRNGANDWDDGGTWDSPGSSARGDVRIAMIVQDGVNGVLAYNYYPRNGDMVLDRAENWASSSNNYRFLRNVVMHEHGHGIGLRHSCPSNGTKLMEPSLSTAFDGPQHDDIRGAQYLYGDDNENDNSTAAARYVGLIADGGSLELGSVPSPSVSNGSLLSIDADGESDYFRFTLPAGAALSLTLTPVGLSYDTSQQSGSTCLSGNIVNSLTMANLSAQVLASNGTTVLATAAAQPAGVAESLDEVLLGGAGDYYLRVYETGTVTGPQLYRVELEVTIVDCNLNQVLDTIDLANGTSRDCNGNGRPDECETGLDGNGDLVPDSCQWARGDLDLDGDADLADFGILQACMTGPSATATGACVKASLNGDTHVDAMDVSLFIKCLSGEGVPLNWNCR
jgi:hypothetical protein